MQPFRSFRYRLGLYLGVWLPVTGLLTALFALIGDCAWIESVVIALPLVTVYAFLCINAGYTCRVLPLAQDRLGRVILTHLAIALLLPSLWVGLARMIGMVLEGMSLFPGISTRVSAQAGQLFTLGMLLYLLAVAVHYLMAAVAASRLAEKRALEADLAAREAELRALKAQIDPHFLFNSLNSISALVSRDPEASRRVCAELGDLLRSSLQIGPLQTVRLEDELALVNRYLSIEKVRLGDRLEVDERVEEAGRSWRVPPLLLQPLVENALKHGIGNLLEGGVIQMSAKVDGDHLRIVVENPIDPTAAPRPGTGTGLRNLKRRLVGLYGDAALFRAGRKGERYRVEIVLPRHRGEGADETA